MTRVKTTPRLLVADDLLAIFDEVSEFNDCCSFFCDAFASLVGEQEILDHSTVEGVRCHAEWIKQRMREIKDGLKMCTGRLYIKHRRAYNEDHCLTL